jgi:hypothetical protein
MIVLAFLGNLSYTFLVKIINTFISLLFLVWSASAVLSVIALTQNSGWNNLVLLALFLLAFRNASSLFLLLRKELNLDRFFKPFFSRQVG